MDEIMKTMAASASGMAAQAARLRLSSENIANADTPGYRRKTVSFEETFTTNDVRAVRTGPGFVCRNRNHQIGGKLSAHASGLAVDIASFELVNGEVLSIAEAKDGRKMAVLATLLPGLERKPRAGDRGRPRGEPLIRGQPPHVRPGAGDGELAHRPPAPLTGTG